MAKSNTRLELTWIGKENRPKLEPRILIEDATKSYHATRRVGDNDLFDNRLIFGDNLLALRALEQEFTGKIKCIYIDPPYNTGSAFTHYDDGVEHSLWLSLMYERVKILRSLLTKDGTLWVNLDDNEGHYAKVMLDEVFGRTNFLGTVVWEKSDSPRMDAQYFSSRHDYLFCYGRDKNVVTFHKIITNDIAQHYNRRDENGRLYYTKPLRAMGGQGDSRAARPNLYFALPAPDGTKVFPKKQDGTDGAWRWSPEKCSQEHERIEWVQGRAGWTPYYRIYADNIRSKPPETIWPHGEVGSNRTSKAEIKLLLNDIDINVFGTPKPEGLLQRVIHIATNPGDLVLDSFAGSGTTGAVAHKMGRRWIMIELGDHCHTHIIPRMRKVIDGEDGGGVTNTVGWKGGGGFHYYRLAPSLIIEDAWGNPVINPEFNAAMLAEAMCKLEGFVFDPGPDMYWQQGRSTESDFIYVTTQVMTRDMLAKLSDEVGPNRSLLVCCGAFRCDVASFENLTVKKIPKAVLKKCEWGHDDYSLEIKNLPAPPDSPSADDGQAAQGDSGIGIQDKPRPRSRKFGKGKYTGPNLFDREGAGNG